MITNTTQNWTTGNIVKVGFLSLMVVAAIPTPGDGLPDEYILASTKAFYSFIPHNGLVKISPEEATASIERGKAVAAQIAAQALAKAAAFNAHGFLVGKLMTA